MYPNSNYEKKPFMVEQINSSLYLLQACLIKPLNFSPMIIPNQIMQLRNTYIIYTYKYK